MAMLSMPPMPSLNVYQMAVELAEQNRTEQNFIGNYNNPRWHKSKPYKIQETYKTHTCIIYTAENSNIGSLTI